MNHSNMHPDLQNLLRQRVNVISDTGFRDRDPAAHLNALKAVSTEISAYALAHQAEFDAKMRHYLTNSSFQKALEHLESA